MPAPLWGNAVSVSPIREKGDFSAHLDLVWLSAMAVVVGVLCAFVAVGLQALIGFFTNLFYYHEVSLVFRESPAEQAAALGWWAVPIPVVGGLIIGLMARYGSDRIRGHGIPEALEAILIGQSRMSPRVAILKPLSSAISIGSGGPFGAEGPIIMTGGAVGSIIAQIFRMTAAERKTLLVAGAAGGMSATFSTPMAAVLLAVELLLFEWRPRSFVPVAIASAVAAMIRPLTHLGPGPIFPVPPHANPLGIDIMLSSALVGLACGLLALLLTIAVYAFEDGFMRLPIHWMWWPAIGGLGVGIGGYFQPHALGVGYDTIRSLLEGGYNSPDLIRALVGLIIVKCLIWSFSLGSGTSGGVLAPLLIMGGALGAILSIFLPGQDPALWPLVSMAAALGGTMRSPLTGVIFALELTHDIHALPAILIACVFSHAFTVLVMKRSILTEKVARRGYHVFREYAVDPLERLNVGDVMATNVITIPAATPVKRLVEEFFLGHGPKHQGYPVLDEDGSLAGIITKADILDRWIKGLVKGTNPDLALDPIIAYDLVQRAPITVYPDETCRSAVEKMAAAGIGRLLVVSSQDPRKLVGIVTRSDLLKPRARLAEEEQRRERFIGPGLISSTQDK
jgi:H+/Cl- antiporter ClcA/predicted transcriptional regulator